MVLRNLGACFGVVFIEIGLYSGVLINYGVSFGVVVNFGLCYDVVIHDFVVVWCCVKISVVIIICRGQIMTMDIDSNKSEHNSNFGVVLKRYLSLF